MFAEAYRKLYLSLSHYSSECEASLWQKVPRVAVLASGPQECWAVGFLVNP